MNNYQDYIYDLPFVKNKKQSEVEVELLKTLFKKNKPLINFAIKESYESFLVALLFLFFSIPYTDNIIKSIVPVSENLYILLFVIKFLLIMLLYWIMKISLF